MEAEELEWRRNYLGEPDEYVPYFAPEQGPDVDLFRAPMVKPADAMVAKKVLDYAGKLALPQHKHSVANLAEVRPDKAQAVFLDEQGRVVDAEGQTVEVPEGAVIVDAQGQVAGPSAVQPRLEPQQTTLRRTVRGGETQSTQSPAVTLESVMQMLGIEKG
jgi:hypothetical protein